MGAVDILQHLYHQAPDQAAIYLRERPYQPLGGCIRSEVFKHIRNRWDQSATPFQAPF
tara:strand:+ start:138 stop:311 length:174 start_codon:yes stop_codon:yes gene_type:complete